MYEIHTRDELLLFYQYASAHPKTWEYMENAKVEHTKLGSGTIVGYVPAADSRSDPKIRIRFDIPTTNAEPKLLSLPLVVEKGLLEVLAVPPSVLTSFLTFAIPEMQLNMAEASLRERLSPQSPSTLILKEDWRRFEEALGLHGIERLYHFTDSRNLASIRKHGGLYSWLQCERRGIKVTAPGGGSSSRWRDQTKGLEDYVRLSFNGDLPMMHVAVRQGRLQSAEILEIDPSVIYLSQTLFSDINANTTGACVGGDLESFERIRFDVATGPCWNGECEKRWFQAEVLVRGHVPLGLIQNL